MAAAGLRESAFLACSASRPFIPRCTRSPSRVCFQLVSQPVLTSCASLSSIGIPKVSGCRRKRTFCFKVSAKVRELTGPITNVDDLRFAVVAGWFNEFITRPLVAGALEAFKKYTIKDDNIDVVWVPGSFEIPVVTQALAKTGKYHAVLCIGTVIRGETTHYDAVANSAASGVLSASLKSGIPCIFGVLTCETLDQTVHRAGGKEGNKGAEAAITAIEMASLFPNKISIYLVPP